MWLQFTAHVSWSKVAEKVVIDVDARCRGGFEGGIAQAAAQ